MQAREVRTGDVIMPPSATVPSTVMRATTQHDTTSFQYTDANARAEMPPATPVRVYRTSRAINHDTPTPTPVHTTISDPFTVRTSA